MGKFQNYELNAQERSLQEIRIKQRMELRQQYWKNITDPKRYASGEGGHLVNKNFSLCSLYLHITSAHSVMSSIDFISFS